jgi:predicted kinase
MNNIRLSTSQKSQLIQYVKQALDSGQLVILTGRPRTGKSLLVSQIFPDESVVDKKIHALRGEDARVSLAALDFWVVRTQVALAVDEAQSLSGEELMSIVKATTVCRRGLLVATQSLENISETIVHEAARNHTKVIHIQLTKSVNEGEQPEWESSEIRTHG